MLVTLLAMSSLSSLTACETSSTDPGVRTVSDYCLIARGISYASQPAGQEEDSRNRFDTAETVRDVEEHNVVYRRRCPRPVQPAE